MFFWCFIIIAVINMKSSIALKQNKLDSVSEDDLVADEVKEKGDEPKMEEMNCIRGVRRSSCCRSKLFTKTEPCTKPMCIELACKEKECGDACKLSYLTLKKTDSNVTLKCNHKGQCIKTKQPKSTLCEKSRKEECKKDKDCKCWCYQDAIGKCNKKTETCEHCKCKGRPFLVDGKYRTTTSFVKKVERSDGKKLWELHLFPRGSSNTSLNHAIALEFANQGEAEHASVASFARHTLQLMTMGAPPSLLIGSQEAALDEIRHAKMCYGIANSFLGAHIQPSIFDVDDSVKTISNDEIIRSVIIEGCIGETIAAVQAQLGAHYAKEPIVKGILENIAVDESNHAQLAWNTVKWAIVRFPELGNVAEETFTSRLNRPTEMSISLPTDNCYDYEKNSAFHDHGLLIDIDEYTTENLGVQHVIEPALENEFQNVETISARISNIDFSKFQ